MTNEKDEKKTAEEKPKEGLDAKPDRKERIENFWGLVTEFREEIIKSTKLGVVGFVLYWLNRNADGRSLLFELRDAAINLAGDLGLNEANIKWADDKRQQAFRYLSRTFLLLGGAILLSTYILVIMSTNMDKAQDRGIYMVPVALALMVFSLNFVRQWVPALIAFGVANRFLDPEGKGEGFSSRLLRVLAKLNAWYFFGVIIAIIAPFHNAPALLWMGWPASFNYIYFCNSWRRGESEHIRRTILWLTAFFQGDMILLTPFPEAVRWLTTKGDSVHDRAVIVMAAIALIQFALGMWFGNRMTTEDKAREYKNASEALKGVDLEHAFKVGQMIGLDRKFQVGANTTSDLANRANMSQYATRIRPVKPDPRGRFLEVVGVVTTIGLVILAIDYLVITFAPWVFTLNTAIHP